MWVHAYRYVVIKCLYFWFLHVQHVDPSQLMHILENNDQKNSFHFHASSVNSSCASNCVEDIDTDDSLVTIPGSKNLGSFSWQRVVVDTGK